MRYRPIFPVAASALIGLFLLLGLGMGCGDQGSAQAQETRKSLSENDRQIAAHARMMDQARQIVRFDTFGSETFWGDALQLHKAIAGEKNGGVGDGISPKKGGFYHDGRLPR